MFDMIRRQLSDAVPYARHSGVELLEIGDGYATAQLPQKDFTLNHIATQHAGALFTLGETASGGAMAGAIAPVLLQARPVAACASIAYKRIAKGLISAKATTSRAGSMILAELKEQKKAVFDADVIMTDEDGEEVATLKVEWNVRLS